jgi:hypothetical protein
MEHIPDASLEYYRYAQGRFKTFVDPRHFYF